MKLRNFVILVIVLFLILTASLKTVNEILISRKPLPPPSGGSVRLAFFSDPHIRNIRGAVQADLGRPSYEIPRNAKRAINTINSDYIFGLGDLTAYSKRDEWLGYKSWIEDLNAPVFDLLGNHDKDYTVHTVGKYGQEYFTELGRVADTRVLKLGNNVFILVSEEHDPEGDGNELASTIPDKRFDFIEKYLKEYSETDNVFVMAHSPLSGTTAYSETWFGGKTKNWIYNTRKYLDLFRNYRIVAHISGHIHMDYRTKDVPDDQDGTQGAENVGKFIHGSEVDNSKIEYHSGPLPPMYFLNMPCMDIAHGFFDIIHSWLIRLGVKRLILIRSLFTDKSGAPALKIYMRLDGLGLPLVDFFHNPTTSYFLGRSAVYHFELEEGRDSVDIITRWVDANKDVENYTMELNFPVEVGDGSMQFIDSDLSLRDKENLTITKGNWFKIEKNTKGQGEFSKRFPEKVVIEGLTFDGNNTGNYSAQWKGSIDGGKNWSRYWYDNPRDLGEIDAIMLKIEFESLPDKDWYVRDVVIRTI
jgi:predicted MPP superfamily phosphohydrolase